MPVQQAAPHRTVARFVDHLERFVSVPLDSDDFGGPLGRDPAHRDAGLHLLEARHATAAKETTLSPAIPPTLTPTDPEDRHWIYISILSAEGRSNFSDRLARAPKAGALHSMPVFSQRLNIIYINAL